MKTLIFASILTLSQFANASGADLICESQDVPTLKVIIGIFTDTQDIEATTLEMFRGRQKVFSGDPQTFSNASEAIVEATGSSTLIQVNMANELDGVMANPTVRLHVESSGQAVIDNEKIRCTIQGWDD